MSARLRRVPLVAAAFVVVLAGSGCGEVSDKQVRVESGAISSTAAEAAELADQRIRGRVPLRFTKAQGKTLAKQFGKSLQATTAKPAEPATRMLQSQAAALALAGQQQALLLVAEANYKARLNTIKDNLSDIGSRADDLASKAEARED